VHVASTTWRAITRDPEIDSSALRDRARAPTAHRIDPDLLAAIDEALARGVAPGLREALAERSVEEMGASGADQTRTALGVGRRPRVGVARSGDKRKAADITAEPAAEEPR
jgi:hypothetical protein